MVNPTPNLKKNRMHMANHIPNPKWKKPRSMAKTGIHTNIKGVVAQTSMELLEASLALNKAASI